MEAYIQQNALLVYAIVMIAAALLHWGQKVKKGEASADFMAYWFTETPGYSLGTFGALAGGLWLIYTMDGLKGMAPQMVVEGAFATGWMINSAVAPGLGAPVPVGTPPKAAGFIRFALLPWLFVMAFVVALYGCGSQMTIHPAQEHVTPAKATQNLIDETNAGLTAAYTAVLNGLQSGAMTKAEATKYQADLDKASDAIDASSIFLGKGDITSAQGQIQIAQSIISLAQSKLIELKQKGK